MQVFSCNSIEDSWSYFSCKTILKNYVVFDDDDVILTYASGPEADDVQGLVCCICTESCVQAETKTAVSQSIAWFD